MRHYVRVKMSQQPFVMDSHGLFCSYLTLIKSMGTLAIQTYPLMRHCQPFLKTSFLSVNSVLLMFDICYLVTECDSIEYLVCFFFGFFFVNRNFTTIFCSVLFCLGLCCCFFVFLFFLVLVSWEYANRRENIKMFFHLFSQIRKSIILPKGHKNT